MRVFLGLAPPWENKTRKIQIWFKLKRALNTDQVYYYLAERILMIKHFKGETKVIVGKGHVSWTAAISCFI